jgi:ABC-type branched-subunit amino acid transport system permease subunit
MRNNLLVLAVGAVLLTAVGWFFETYLLFNLCVYGILAIFALSLALVWGFGGILSMGHAAFFGLGAYGYAVASLNGVDTLLSVLIAIVAPTVAAAALGAFIFYGRVGTVYIGVIGLTFCLIFYSIASSSSGREYRIGAARLGGYNGIPAIPSIAIPWLAPDGLDYRGMYYLSVGALLVVYVGMRIVVQSPFGRVLISVRENELRSELLGYDIRAIKLASLCIGAAVAGFAGALYASWGSVVNPTVFSLPFCAQVIIWVVFGGIGTLIGPVVGCFLVLALTNKLGQLGLNNPQILLGALFVGSVLLLPKGIVPTLTNWLKRRSEPRTGTAFLGSSGRVRP